MRLFVTVLFTVSFGFLSVSQENIDLSQDEDQLVLLLDELRQAKTNAERKAANIAFKKKLSSVIENKEALTYPFSKLTTVGVIDSPDEVMRIINWNVEQEDFSHTYNCFVLHLDKRRKKYNVVELKDISFGMPSQPTEILSSDQWYGALYYKIIPVKKGSKTLYTVLGWDHNSSMSQMKLIDVIYFTGKTVKLGSSIFVEAGVTKKRVFFEHSKKTSMSLKFEEERNRIIFDHLSPESPSMKKFRSFYVPDLSYDAFVLDGSKWLLNEDVIGVNKGVSSKESTVLVQDPNSGKVEKQTIKTEWLDPTSEDNKHVAITPESQLEKETKKKKDQLPEVDKKDKRDPSKVSFYKDVKKKRRKRNKK